MLLLVQIIHWKSCKFELLPGLWNFGDSRTVRSWRWWPRRCCARALHTGGKKSSRPVFFLVTGICYNLNCNSCMNKVEKGSDLQLKCGWARFPHALKLEADYSVAGYCLSWYSWLKIACVTTPQECFHACPSSPSSEWIPGVLFCYRGAMPVRCKVRKLTERCWTFWKSYLAITASSR